MFKFYPKGQTDIVSIDSSLIMLPMNEYLIFCLFFFLFLILNLSFLLCTYTLCPLLPLWRLAVGQWQRTVGSLAFLQKHGCIGSQCSPAPVAM